MKNLKSALLTSQDSSFETVRIETNDKLTVPAWREVLNDDSIPLNAEVSTTAIDDPHVQYGNRPAKSRRPMKTWSSNK